MKLSYVTPATKVMNLEPMQMLAASNPKVGIVDDTEKKVNPSTSFSDGKEWGNEGWDDEE